MHTCFQDEYPQAAIRAEPGLASNPVESVLTATGREARPRRSNRSRRAGFTLVEVMVVVAIIGLLAASAMPNFMLMRKRAQANACINNLRQIDDAKQLWALENRKSPSDIPAISDLTKYLSPGAVGRWPACPTGNGDYDILSVSVPPKCHTYDSPTDPSIPPHRLGSGSGS